MDSSVTGNAARVTRKNQNPVSYADLLPLKGMIGGETCIRWVEVQQNSQEVSSLLYREASAGLLEKGLEVVLLDIGEERT